jgi:hypothetical protein
VSVVSSGADGPMLLCRIAELGVPALSQTALPASVEALIALWQQYADNIHSVHDRMQYSLKIIYSRTTRPPPLGQNTRQPPSVSDMARSITHQSSRAQSPTGRSAGAKMSSPGYKQRPMSPTRSPTGLDVSHVEELIALERLRNQGMLTSEQLAQKRFWRQNKDILMAHSLNARVLVVYAVQAYATVLVV